MSNTLLNITQYCYTYFWFKLIIVEAQMPEEGKTFEQILRKVTLMIKFMRSITVFFILYMLAKWVLQLITIKYILLS